MTDLLLRNLSSCESKLSFPSSNYFFVSKVSDSWEFLLSVFLWGSQVKATSLSFLKEERGFGQLAAFEMAFPAGVFTFLPIPESSDLNFHQREFYSLYFTLLRPLTLRLRWSVFRSSLGIPRIHRKGGLKAPLRSPQELSSEMDKEKFGSRLIGQEFSCRSESGLCEAQPKIGGTWLVPCLRGRELLERWRIDRFLSFD